MMKFSNSSTLPVLSSPSSLKLFDIIGTRHAIPTITSKFFETIEPSKINILDKSKELLFSFSNGFGVTDYEYALSLLQNYCDSKIAHNRLIDSTKFIFGTFSCRNLPENKYFAKDFKGEWSYETSQWSTKHQRVLNVYLSKIKFVQTNALTTIFPAEINVFNDKKRMMSFYIHEDKENFQTVLTLLHTHCLSRANPRNDETQKFIEGTFDCQNFPQNSVFPMHFGGEWIYRKRNCEDVDQNVLNIHIKKRCLRRAKSILPQVRSKTKENHMNRKKDFLLPKYPNKLASFFLQRDFSVKYKLPVGFSRALQMYSENEIVEFLESVKLDQNVDLLN